MKQAQFKNKLLLICLVAAIVVIISVIAVRNNKSSIANMGITDIESESGKNPDLSSVDSVTAADSAQNSIDLSAKSESPETDLQNDSQSELKNEMNNSDDNAPSTDVGFTDTIEDTGDSTDTEVVITEEFFVELEEDESVGGF